MSKNDDKKVNYSTCRKLLIDLEHNAKFLRYRLYVTRLRDIDINNLRKTIQLLQEEKDKEIGTE